jgi:hypothetical protein
MSETVDGLPRQYSTSFGLYFLLGVLCGLEVEITSKDLASIGGKNTSGGSAISPPVKWKER